MQQLNKWRLNGLCLSLSFSLSFESNEFSTSDGETKRFSFKMPWVLIQFIPRPKLFESMWRFDSLETSISDNRYEWLNRVIEKLFLYMYTLIFSQFFSDIFTNNYYNIYR